MGFPFCNVLGAKLGTEALLDRGSSARARQWNFEWSAPSREEGSWRARERGSEGAGGSVTSLISRKCALPFANCTGGKQPLASAAVFTFSVPTSSILKTAKCV